MEDTSSTSPHAAGPIQAPARSARQGDAGRGDLASRVPLDESGRIAADLPCRACGYNLRGLSPRGDCPECGQSVHHSLIGDLLRFADPRWVGTLAGGMRLLMAAIVVGFVTFFIDLVLSNAAFPPSTSPYVVVASVAWGLGLIEHLAVPGLVLLGVWRVTTPEVGRPSAAGLSVRKLARVGVIGGAGFMLTSNAATVMVWHPRFPGPFFYGGFWSLMFFLIALILLMVGFFAGFTYLRGLALRLPDHGLARQTRIVMWGAAACVGIFIAVIAGGIAMAVHALGMGGSSASGAAGAMHLPAFGILLALGSCMASVGLVVLSIWSLILMELYRRRFTKAADDAAGLPRERSAGETPTPTTS